MRHAVIGDVRLQEVLEHPGVWALIAFTYHGGLSAPCKHFKPEFSRLAAHFAGKLYAAEINAGENPTITETMKVTAVPTTLLLYNGLEQARFEGPYSCEALIERTSQVLKRSR